MPEHLIRSFYIAKAFCDNIQANKPRRIPAMKNRDLQNVLKYIRLLQQPQLS